MNHMLSTNKCHVSTPSSGSTSPAITSEMPYRQALEGGDSQSITNDVFKTQEKQEDSLSDYARDLEREILGW